jgi:hypothetical protein
MLYSSLLGRPVELPLDSAAFEQALNKLIEGSTFARGAVVQAEVDADKLHPMGQSFSTP